MITISFLQSYLTLQSSQIEKLNRTKAISIKPKYTFFNVTSKCLY